NAIIVAEDNFIWRSTDDGMSWDVVEQFALTGIGGFAKAGTKLFGAARTGIQTSTDNGASWNFEPFSNGAYSFSAVGSTIYLGSNNEVFKSTDLGATWIDMSTGLGKGGIQALLYDGTTLFAGTPADAAGIYRSTNGGQSWDPAAAGLPIASEVRSLIAFGGYVFVGMQGDGIYRSSDHGDTWAKTDVNNPLLSNALVLAFLDKALQSKACTNPRMQALRGRRGRPLTWTSSVSRQTETMCSQVTCLALITHWISEKAGLLVIRPAIAPSVAVSSPIQLEA